jgi:ferritin
MKVVICDRCRRVLNHPGDKIFERYDVVSVSNQERKELCATCYPHFQELNRRLEQFASLKLKEADAEEKELVERFWKEGVKAEDGKQQPGRPQTWVPPTRR